MLAQQWHYTCGGCVVQRLSRLALPDLCLYGILLIMSDHKRKQHASGETVSKDLNEPTGSWIIAEQSTSLWWRNRVTGGFLVIIPLLLSYLGVTLATRTDGDMTRITLSIIFLSVGILWALVSSAPAIYFQLRAARGHRPGIWESYRQGLRILPRLIGLSLMTALFVLAGLVLFIIPGIIFFRRYFLAPYYMVERNLGIRESLAQSARDSKAYSSYVWGTLALTLIVFPLGSSVASLVYPPFGGLLSVFIGSLYLFGPAIRYTEISDLQTAKTLKASKTSKGKQPTRAGKK